MDGTHDNQNLAELFHSASGNLGQVSLSQSWVILKGLPFFKVMPRLATVYGR